MSEPFDIIEFNNNQGPYISDLNLNKIQTDIRNAVKNTGLSSTLKKLQNTDINSITDGEIVYLDNCTVGSNPINDGYLITLVESANNMLQIYYPADTANGDFSIRHKSSGTWENWINYDNRLRTSTPELLNCTATYTDRECNYVKMGKTVIGTCVIRGSITAVDSGNPYARVKLNIPGLNTWNWISFATIQEAGYCTNETPYWANFTGADEIGLQSQGGGTGAAQWVTSNSFYVKLGFTILNS